MTDRSRTRGPTRRQYLRTGTALLAGGLIAGCPGAPDSGGGEGEPTPVDGADIPYDVSVDHDLSAWVGHQPDWEPPTEAPPTDGYAVDVLIENLEIPWDVSVQPDGGMLLTERTGRVLSVESGDLDPLAAPENVVDAGSVEPGSDEDSWYVEGGEGGLLGVATHPTYPEPPVVYVYFTAETDDGRENRVVAIDASADDPAANTWTVVGGIPADAYHNGGRIEFGPANYLWITTGDGDPGLENPDAIRDPGTLAGKILRVEPDGTAPADNPSLGADADPRVYTYGHRNPQGLAWLPDGTPIASEHGPGGGDEINVLVAGEDYGWPNVRGSGDFTPYADSDAHPPVASASSWAPSGCVFYTGDAVPALRNRLLVGGLISQQIVACTLHEDGRPASGHDQIHDEPWMDDAYAVGTSAVLDDELGRVRHVEQGADGALYAITSNRDGRAQGRFPTERDDRLVRIRREDA